MSSRYSHIVTGDLIAYDQTTTWMQRVSDFVSPLLPSGALAGWQKWRLDKLYIDDPEWLRILGSELSWSVDSVIEDFAEAMKPASILGFHGCRPLDLNGHLRNGVKALDQSELMQLLDEVIQKLEIPQLREEILEQGRTRLGEHTYSFVYLALDQRHLLRYAGHYLIYGSEWLCSVFGKCRELLRNCGTPTVIEIALPLARASESDRRQLARHLLQEWTRLSALSLHESSPVDFSFAVRERIEAKMIVGHSHPPAIRDPLDGGRNFINDRTACRHCNLR